MTHYRSLRWPNVHSLTREQLEQVIIQPDPDPNSRGWFLWIPGEHFIDYHNRYIKKNGDPTSFICMAHQGEHFWETFEAASTFLTRLKKNFDKPIMLTKESKLSKVSFADQIIAAMNASGKTDSCFADVAGLTPSGISKFKSGDRSMSLKRFEILAKELGFELTQRG